MLPAIGLVRIGKARRTVPLPLPIFLAWPFVLVALSGVAVAERLAPTRSTNSKLTIARFGGVVSSLGPQDRPAIDGWLARIHLIFLTILLTEREKR